MVARPVAVNPCPTTMLWRAASRRRPKDPWAAGLALRMQQYRIRFGRSSAMTPTQAFARIVEIGARTDCRFAKTPQDNV
jgi:hypothetical protein